MKRIKKHMTTIAVIVLSMLLAYSLMAVSLPGQEKLAIQDHVYYQKCDVCGEQVPSTLTVVINLSWEGWSKSIPDTIKMNFMKPYGKVRYCVCFKCILKTLKVPPEGDLK